VVSCSADTHHSRPMIAGRRQPMKAEHDIHCQTPKPIDEISIRRRNFIPLMRRLNGFGLLRYWKAAFVSSCSISTPQCRCSKVHVIKFGIGIKCDTGTQNVAKSVLAQNYLDYFEPTVQIETSCLDKKVKTNFLTS